MTAAPAPLRAAGDARQRRALDAVVEVARGAGLGAAGAGIWRAGSAVLVGLPAVPALARVDDLARPADAARQVVVAGLLHERGVPAVELVGPSAQPIASPAGPVTIWRWEPADGPPVGPAAFGAVARHLHDATRDLAARAPVHDPMGAVGAELDRAEEAGRTPPPELALLRDVRRRLVEGWPDAAADPLGGALVHGDLHRANVIAARRGAVLADLELAGWGPASADVAPQVVAVRRYGVEPDALEAFLAGYGADPRRWPGLEVLVEGYELWVTAWAVANREASARVEHEAQVRVARWRGDAGADWSLR